jgi:hypothetical protein
MPEQPMDTSHLKSQQPNFTPEAGSASALAPKFHALFLGCERAHGYYGPLAPDPTRGDGKLKGQALTKREPLTDALWESHLAGKTGIGVIPIRDDSTCVFGAIDIDAYTDFNPASVAAEVARLKLPMVVCRSKSGGAHVYCFSRNTVHLKQLCGILF